MHAFLDRLRHAGERHGNVLGGDTAILEGQIKRGDEFKLKALLAANRVRAVEPNNPVPNAEKS